MSNWTCDTQVVPVSRNATMSTVSLSNAEEISQFNNKINLYLTDRISDADVSHVHPG